MAPNLLMYQGEVPVIIVTLAMVTIAGGLFAFMKNVALPISLKHGAVILRPVDIDLSKLTGADQKTINRMRVDATAQWVEPTVIGGAEAYELFVGTTLTQVPVSSVREKSQNPAEGEPSAFPSPDGYVQGVPSKRVAEGLEFFLNVGHLARHTKSLFYVTDSEATERTGTGHANVGPSRQFDNLRFFWGCLMNIPGISRVMWYMAVLGCVSSFHIEDLAGLSFFLLLEGACKSWLAIPASYTAKLVSCLEGRGGRLLVKALYEKRLVIPTAWLDGWNIAYFSVTQQPGDLVITSGPHEVRELHITLGPVKHARVYLSGREQWYIIY